MNEFAKELRFMRDKAGMTQEDLAQKIGYCRWSVHCWERGQRIPNHDAIEKLQELFPNLPTPKFVRGESF